MKRPAAHSLAAVLVLVGLAGIPSTQEDEVARPDVLVVVLDDLGWPEVEATPTPALDAFAHRGVTYRRAYVTPLCTPTRYALLFGRHAFRSGIGNVLRTNSDDVVTGPPLAETSLAEVLRDAGYSTAAFGKWHLSNQTEGPLALGPQRHGFDTWRAGVPGNLTDYYDWERAEDGELLRDRTYNTTAVADATIGWWRGASSPRFAYVGFQAVHHPIQEPPKELLASDSAESSAAPVEGPEIPIHRRRVRLPGDFRNMIRALDHELGRVLDAVDLSTTYVWIVCDNGPSPALSIADPEAKNSMGEAGIHVPAWAAGPGLSQGRASEHLVQAIDLFAIVARWTGVAIPEGVAEDSLPLGSRREAFVHVFSPNGALDPAAWQRDERAAILLRPPLKLVRDADGERVYDLRRDPWGLAPLAEGRVEPAHLQRLRRVIELPEENR